MHIIVPYKRAIIVVVVVAQSRPIYFATAVSQYPVELCLCDSPSEGGAYGTHAFFGALTCAYSQWTQRNAAEGFHRQKGRYNIPIHARSTVLVRVRSMPVYFEVCIYLFWTKISFIGGLACRCVKRAAFPLSDNVGDSAGTDAPLPISPNPSRRGDLRGFRRPASVYPSHWTERYYYYCPVVALQQQ